MKTIKRMSVRYAETDQMGVVWHGNYLLYLEEARTALVAELGFPYAQVEEAGFMAPVVNVSIDYGMPLKYGEEAAVVVWVSKLSPAKVTYAYEVYGNEAEIGEAQPRVRAHSEHCLVDAKTFRPVSMKRALPELYAAYERALETE